MNKSYKEIIRSIMNLSKKPDIASIIGEDYSNINKTPPMHCLYLKSNNSILLKYSISQEVVFKISHWLKSLKNTDNTEKVLEALLIKAESIQQNALCHNPYFKFQPEHVFGMLLDIVKSNNLKTPIPTTEIGITLATELNRIFDLPKSGIHKKYLLQHFMYLLHLYNRNQELPKIQTQTEGAQTCYTTK